MKKSEVLAVLAAPSQKAARFNALLPCLGAGKSRGSFAFYNRAGYSKSNLSSLEYDVMKMYGIKARDVSAFAKANSGKKGTEVITLDPGQQKAADQAKVFQEAPEEVKKTVKLRERYPFLNDRNCPEKLHTLVGLNGTAYNAVVEARKELFTKVVAAEEAEGDPETVGLTNEEIFEIAIQAVKDFELNIEGQEELDYYRDNGEILGKHPIFIDEVLQKKVNSYKPGKLSSQYTNLKGYVNREAKKLEKDMEDDKRLAILGKLEQWEKEIRLIEVRLEVPAEKAFVSKIPAQDAATGSDSTEEE